MFDSFLVSKDKTAFEVMTQPIAKILIAKSQGQKSDADES